MIIYFDKKLTDSNSHNNERVTTKKMDLKEIFKKLKNKNTLLILLILIIIALMSSVLKQIFFAALFIFIAALSKFYYRFFKSTLGFDFVLYGTLMISLVYTNFILSFMVAWIGLIFADMLAQKFNHNSLISLFGLTIIVLISKLFIGYPILVSLILLTLLYELIVSVLYFFAGSNWSKILVFVSSHIIFNMILITSLTNLLMSVM